MSYVALIASTTVRNSFRLRSVGAVVTGIVLICVAGLAVLFGTQFLAPLARVQAPDRSAVENYLGLILYTTSFITIGIYSSVYAVQSLIREKTRGSIQALLATPISARELWIGKCLGVFIPSLIIAEVMSIAALIVVNLVWVAPSMPFVVNPAMIASDFVAVPLVYLALTTLVHAMGLSGSPATGNVVAQLFLPVIVALMINLAVRDLVNAGSWLFTGLLLAIAAAIGAFVVAAGGRLTAESIMLSQ